MLDISRRRFLAGSAAAAVLCHLDQNGWAQQEPSDDPNAFLYGNFAPIQDEIAVADLKVIGRLPDDLDGMFVRNGPNPQFIPPNNYHLFDGDGMLHGVRVRDGKASYRNRWVRTAAWKEEHQAGKAVYPSVLDPPDLRWAARKMLAGELPLPNRANTAVIWHHGKLLALWEAGVPYEISLPELDTVGQYAFGGALKHAFTAHPKIDATTGELMFFGYSPFAPTIQYSIADRRGTITSTTSIELPRTVMIHDVAITQNYTLFLDTPGVIDVSGVLTGKPLFSWQPQHGARIGVLPRHGQGDQIQWFDIEPCFVFHVFNAFEDNDQIHLLACRFSEYPSFVDLNRPTTVSEFAERVGATPPLATRWTLDLKSGAVQETCLDDLPCEFPRVDDALAGLKTRYGYAVAGDAMSSEVAKFDFDRGTKVTHPYGKGRLSGECVFVARRESRGEDDGYLVSHVFDETQQRSEMVVVDARDLAAAPLARVMMPQRVPFGFHGMWVDGRYL